MQTTSIIGPSRGIKTTIHLDGDTNDIIDTIMSMDEKSAAYILPGVENLRGRSDKETLQNIFNFVKNRILFKADGGKEQIVKSPGSLFSSGVGDCKSFSIALGAMCRHFGIPYRYRFVAQTPGDFTHVYPIATISSKTGQRKDIILDVVYGPFNRELSYIKHTDRTPGAGAATVGALLDEGGAIVLILGVLAFLILKPKIL